MTVHILPVHESVAIGGATIRKQEGDLTNQCHSNGGDICKTWCVVIGIREMKSQNMSGSLRWVTCIKIALMVVVVGMEL